MNQETMIKLGTKVTDLATGRAGMLIHMQIEMNGGRFYNFQPNGLNGETGQPLKRAWLAPARVQDGVEVPMADIPLKALGSFALDRASGFNGMVTALCLHINGCVHATIQPSGSNKVGDCIAAHEFDIRQLKGDEIPVFNEEEQAADEKAKPSPAEVLRYEPGQS